MRGAQKPAAPVAGPAFIRRAGPVTRLLSTFKPATVGGKMARGMRNNNPGNIRHSASHWQGQAEDQLDPSFVTFTDMKYGVRALARLLQIYQSSYHLFTVKDIINRWAPPNENNTSAYVTAVAVEFDRNATVLVNMYKYIDLYDMVIGIIKRENGLNTITIQPLLSDIIAGINLCLPTTPDH